MFAWLEPVLRDHPFGHKEVVSQDRWSLVTGSVVLKCWSFWQKRVVFQDRWSLMAVVFRDRFHTGLYYEDTLNFMYFFPINTLQYLSLRILGIKTHSLCVLVHVVPVCSIGVGLPWLPCFILASIQEVWVNLYLYMLDRHYRLAVCTSTEFTVPICAS